MISSLKFLENGKVNINNINSVDYYYENDSIYVINGEELALFSLNKNKLKSLSSWNSKDELKLVNSLDYFQNNDSIQNIRSNLIKQYISNNYNLHLKNVSLDNSNEDLLFSINSKNVELCEEGLDLACIQYYSFLMSKHETILEEEKSLSLEQLYNLSNKVIKMGNPDGYGLLFSYYILRDEQEIGEIYLEKGLNLGSQLCMILSLEKLK